MFFIITISHQNIQKKELIKSVKYVMEKNANKKTVCALAAVKKGQTLPKTYHCVAFKVFFLFHLSTLSYQRFKNFMTSEQKQIMNCNMYLITLLLIFIFLL